MAFKLLLLLFGFSVLVSEVRSSRPVESEYTEKLLIKPLQDGHVYTYFEFKTIWHKDIYDLLWENSFDVFPMALSKFLGQHQLQELHFSLSKGLWKHRWGYPVRDSPPGAELWVWFQKWNLNPTKSWSDVTSVLAGHFCASLNFIDKAATVKPKLSLRPEGVIEPTRLSNESIFYAALPQETVCTENLTPWKKLLPCFSKAGLATMLNSGHVFNTHFFSLALDVKPICRDQSCTETSIELVQSLSIVFNPPVLFEGKQSWSLIKLFGSSFKDECKLASSTTIYVDISYNDTSNPHKLIPIPSQVITNKHHETKYAVYNVGEILQDLQNSKKILNIASVYQKEHIYWLSSNPPLYANRYITGYGFSKGGITCLIYNTLQEDIPIIFMEVIPWYLRIFIHTLKIESNNVEVKPTSLYYKPARDRIQPHQIELLFTLPKQSITQITYEFDRAYLKWTEYPPDANHGVYVGSAIITTKLPVSRNSTILPSSITSAYDNNSYFVHIHTESLLVSLPTPDFSMPYNVICLVSTVVSLAFGPIHNLTTRRAQIIRETDQSDAINTKKSLLSKIGSLFKRKKLAETSNEETK